MKHLLLPLALASSPLSPAVAPSALSELGLEPGALVSPGSRALASAEAARVRLLAGMSAERRTAMLGVRVALVGRDEDFLTGTLEIIRALEGPAAARRAARALREDYAHWNGLAGGSRRVALPIRGVTLEAGGSLYSVAGEENALADGWDEHGSRALRIIYHELGHAVEDVAMTDADRAELRALWRANLRRCGVEPHAQDLGNEFFAECTEAWFSVHQLAPRRAGHGPVFFAERFPEMGAFLEKVYGRASAA